MFLFQHPEEYLRSEEAERERAERMNRLLRELRGATPPFDGALTQRLTSAMADDAEAGNAGYGLVHPVPMQRSR